MSKYFDIFTCRDDVAREFDSTSVPDDENIICAVYTYEDYSGSAFVLYRDGDKLYEVNGGHCSCYGLEGQWEPEETTKEAILARKSIVGYNADDDYIRKVLNDEVA